MKKTAIAAGFLVAFLQLPMTAFAGEGSSEDCFEPSCAGSTEARTECGDEWRKYSNCKSNKGESLDN